MLDKMLVGFCLLLSLAAGDHVIDTSLLDWSGVGYLLLVLFAGAMLFYRRKPKQKVQGPEPA